MDPSAAGGFGIDASTAGVFGFDDFVPMVGGTTLPDWANGLQFSRQGCDGETKIFVDPKPKMRKGAYRGLYFAVRIPSSFLAPLKLRR